MDEDNNLAIFNIQSPCVLSTGGNSNYAYILIGTQCIVDLDLAINVCPVDAIIKL